MELNKDCVRDLLIQCEMNLQMTDDGVMNPLNLKDLKSYLKDYSNADIKYTVKQLEEAGLIDARIINASGVTVLDFLIFDITYYGHEFLNNIKNESNWNKIKSIASKVGSTSLNILGQIAVNVISNEINNLFTA